MFSKNELAYLKGELKPNDNYRWYLEYCIRRKLRKFEAEVLPVLLSNAATRRWLIEKVAGYVNGWTNLIGYANGLSGKTKALIDFTKEETSAKHNDVRIEKPDFGLTAGIKADNGFLVAGPVGFEPTTNSLGGCRAILAALRALHPLKRFLTVFSFAPFLPNV